MAAGKKNLTVTVDKLPEMFCFAARLSRCQDVVNLVVCFPPGARYISSGWFTDRVLSLTTTSVGMSTGTNAMLSASSLSLSR